MEINIMEMKVLEMCSVISTLHSKATAEGRGTKNAEDIIFNKNEMLKELEDMGVSKDNMFFGC